MTHQNLLLTEKAIGRHVKRLKKELIKLNHDLKLSEVQNIFSHVLGMKDYHELKKLLIVEKKIDNNTLLEKQSPEEIFAYQEQLENSLEYVKSNLEHYFKHGHLNLILHYCKSNNQEIKNYIQNNALRFFKIAIKNKQFLLSQFILEERLVTLSDLTEIEIFHLFMHCIIYDLKIFEYIFYDLKYPSHMNKDMVGLIIHYLTITKQLKALKHFINDHRVSFQKNFFWNNENKVDLRNNILNRSCYNGDLPMVKYLMEEHNLTSLDDGSTVAQACLSGNLELVKYLIENKKASYLYFDNVTIIKHPKCNVGKFSNDDLYYSTLSSAVLSDNINLIKYLVENKHIDIKEYEYLALRTSLFNNRQCYSYFTQFPESIDYLHQYAQEIFDEIISKPQYHVVNKEKKDDNQLNIIRYLHKNFNLIVKEIRYENNNPKVIDYLKKYKI